MVQKLKLYLAHAYFNRKLIRKYELAVLKKYFETINPFYDIEIKYDKKNYKKIIHGDVLTILKSDVILVFLDSTQTFGTSMEMVYAKAYQKPIFVICKNKKITDNPWIKYHSTKIYKTKEEFIKEMEAKIK